MTQSKYKDGDPIKMPEKNGEELASAVARALRSSTGRALKSKVSSHEVETHSSAVDRSKDGEGFREINLATSPRDFQVVDTISSSSDSFELKSQEPLDKNSDGVPSALKFVLAEEIRPSPYQTRSDFREKDLEELAASIREKGILQPVVVREIEGVSGYELIAGERRLRAAKLAGLVEVPTLLQVFSDKEAVECAIIENAQREDLNPIEEARSFKILSSQFDMTQSAIAEAVGKNRATVSNSLRLLQLEPSVLELVEEGNLSGGHGRVLVTLEQGDQLKFARKVLKQNLSVRALEKLVQAFKVEGEGYAEVDEEEDRFEASLRRLESKISRLTDIEEVKVSVDSQGRKRLGMVFETETSFRRFVAQLKN